MNNIVYDSNWDKKSATDAGGLDVSKYHDPSDVELLASGRSVAETIGSGRYGFRGVVVPRANEQGEQPGVVPNMVATRVIVDPDIPGQSFTYDPTTLNKQSVEKVMSSIEVNSGDTTEQRRLKASQAFSLLRTRSNSSGGQQMNPIADELMGGPANLPSNPLTSQALPVASPAIQGVQNSRVMPSQIAPVTMQPPTTVKVGEDNRSLFGTPAALPSKEVSIRSDVNGAVGPPTYVVEFEVENSPWRTKASYHQVIRNSGTLILVFDTRAVGYPITFPNATDGALAVRITDQPEVFITATTGIQFHLDHYELCILLIKAVRPYSSE